MRSPIKFLFIILLLFSCKDDDDQPLNPLEQLPKATQTGEMTFGCLVNGKVFKPKFFGSNRLNAFYQFVRGAYSLGISSTEEGEGAGSIGIFATDVEDFGPGVYDLVEEESGNFSAIYILGGGLELDSTTSSENPGELIITKFDKVNHIISGTFEFTTFDSNGAEIKISDGRFDLMYTN